MRKLWLILGIMTAMALLIPAAIVFGGAADDPPGHDRRVMIFRSGGGPRLGVEIDDITSAAGPLRYLRVHGDCHAGNILWRGGAPHFVDFDDARMAPAVQDLWMMLSGERERQTAQLAALIEGYSEFNEFNPAELRLIEPLRALRMLHYSAWLARRWEDPIFPVTFPWFNTVRYWGEHILELREQLAALAEPPLELE